MRSLLLVLVLLVGCSEELAPIDLPATVHLSSALSERDSKLSSSAIAEWNAAVGASAVVAMDHATTGCGIFIRYAEAGELAKPSYLADSQVTDECTALIRLRPGLDDSRAAHAVAHELGHLFTGSAAHSDDPSSVMAPRYIPSGWVITDADVEQVIARM